MITITNDGRPRCFKCQKVALTKVGTKWVCGDCFTQYIKKKTEQEEALLIQE